MCFHSKVTKDLTRFVNENCIPKVAIKPITCYKAVHTAKGKYVGVYQNTFVYTGKVQNANLSITSAMRFPLREEYRIQIDEGFHSCKTEAWVRSYHGSNVKKFIIPKGALYYENDNEYVSNQIMLVLPKVRTVKKKTTKKK